LHSLQNSNEIKGDKLSIIRREANRHFRNNKGEYLKEKNNEIKMNSKKKRVRELYRRKINLKMVITIEAT
jgi:hypothetical protein